MFGFVVEYEILKKPGVYMITDLITGRQYIGYSTNIYRRIRVHAKAVGRPEELRQLIETNGPDKFKVEVLYYSFDSDETHLAEIETSLISCYETLFPKGFNVVLYINDPTHRAAIAKAVSRPETRAKMSNSRKLLMQNPENREKHLLATLAGITPERNELIAQAHRGKIWVTNGVANQRVLPDIPIPEGWYRGKTHRPSTGMTPESKERIAQARRGKIWLTDGVNNQQILPIEPIPEGWYRGMTHRRKTD